MQVPDYIKVEDKIESLMEELAVYDFEDPLVAIPVDFKIEEKDNYQKGFLMITQGANYIFRKNILTGLQTFRTFNLLEVATVKYNIASKEIAFLFEEGRDMYLCSEDVSQIAYAIMFVLQTALYGISDIQTFNVVGDAMPDVTFPQRPKFALKWRVIFLVHFYGIKSQQMLPNDYFNKWEEKSSLSSMMIVGPSLHPGRYSYAFGHAIAWESELKTLVLQNFSPSKFPDFFEGFISNAVTINRLAFTDYQKPDKVPTFPDVTAQNSSVKQFHFLRVIAPLVLSFFEKVRNVPQIKSLVLQNITITSEEFAKLTEFAEKNDAMKNTLKSFELSRSEIPDLHFHDFTKMINSFANLHVVSIRNMVGDAMRFLYAICRSNSPIQVIHINCMNFRRPFKPDASLRYPSTLLHLDISFSAFTDEAFVSILTSITNYEMETPIIFETLSVSLSQPSTFQQIGHMDFDNCYSNIVEFDYSGNKFPDESSRFLFAFLFTQKRMRLLSLNQVECEDQVGFLKNVMLLVTAISLPGLHLSGCSCFDSDTFSQFLIALSVQNPNYIRTLTFSGTKSGVSGLAALSELVSQCSNLVEIEADGFESNELDPLMALWRIIESHKTILSCDYPTEDFKKLGISVSKLPEEDKNVMKNIEEKSPISTAGKRDALVMSQISKNVRITTSSEVFRKCALFTYNEAENDFATNQFKILKC